MARLQNSLPLSVRIAFGKPVAMPVTVDHHVHIIRIVVGDRGAFKTGIVEGPARRPLLPQQFPDLTPVGGKAGAASSFGVVAVASVLPVVAVLASGLWQAWRSRSAFAAIAE